MLVEDATSDTAKLGHRISFYLPPPMRATLPSVIVFQNVIILYSFLTPFFHGNACNDSFVHLSNTNAEEELEMKA